MLKLKLQKKLRKSLKVRDANITPYVVEVHTADVEMIIKGLKERIEESVPILFRIPSKSN